MQAAEALGCSVLDLAYHPHASYWVRAGSDFAQFKSWAAKRSPH